MSSPDLYLLCFAIGALWSLAALLLGSFHLGHSSSGHAVHGHSLNAHGVHTHTGGAAQPVKSSGFAWFATLINPSYAAEFLAWFGGIGYLLTRHSGLGFWVDLVLAIAAGLTGAWLLARFLRFLESREKPLDPADYEMIGTLGQVMSAIRNDGVGEVLYLRDGARKSLPARSDDQKPIARGEEVIVTRYENGIAYVRTWDAMTQRLNGPSAWPQNANSLPKENEHVE